MDYRKLYDNLILFRTKINPLEKSEELYTERHHIIPKCLGGDDNPENLVRLTAREHFLAHRFLAKIHPDNVGLCFAALRMSRNNTSKSRRINSKAFENLRKTVREFVIKKNKERWQAMTIEERDLKISKMVEYNKNMSQDERDKKAEKIREGIRNISKERKEEASGKRSEYWENLDEVSKKERSMNQRRINIERHKNMSSEQKKEIYDKVSKTYWSKTPEERESLRLKNSSSQLSMDKEKRNEINARLREAALERESKMTPEAKAERARKLREGREKKKMERDSSTAKVW